MATSSPAKSLVDKSDIAQYHFPPSVSGISINKDQRQLPPVPPNTPHSMRSESHHGLSTSAPSHGMPPHGHARSFSDSAQYRQPLDFESQHGPPTYSGSYGSSSPSATSSYLSPQYPYSNPSYYQYGSSRQNLSPPIPNHHMAARPRPGHSHSRSMSDYHPYATSLPTESTYLSPPTHESPREKSHRLTHTHHRSGSASSIDYMLNHTHISPNPTTRAAETPRYTSPIPSTTSTGAQSQEEDPEMDESSSNDGGSPSERSDSPLPPGKDSQGADQNRYLCPFCSKRFSRPSSLRIHTYSHTGEKPFVCTEEGCGRRFSVQSNMRRHLRVHRMGRTVKKVRYDGEVEGVKGHNGENGSGHARGNSGGSMDSTGGSQDQEDGGLHRSSTV